MHTQRDPLFTYHLVIEAVIRVQRRATPLPIFFISVVIHNGFKGLSKSYFKAYASLWEVC